MQWHKTFVDTRVGYASGGYLVITEGSMWRTSYKGRFVSDEPRLADAKQRAEQHAAQAAERKYR